MYNCVYNFWDENNFPGFKTAIESLYLRSLALYHKEKHNLKDRNRDLACIEKIFPLIEYYYVSLIKLGYINKKNYSNVLEQLKSIDAISIIKPGKIRGVTTGNVIGINPEQAPFNGYSSDEMLKVTVFHELGHIICNKWNEQMRIFCDLLYKNREIRNRLNKNGINSKLDLINGFILIEDGLVQNAAEDVLCRSKNVDRPGFFYYKSEKFPGVKYRSNFIFYTMFQETALSFLRCFNFMGLQGETKVNGAYKKASTLGFDANFMNYIESEMTKDINKMSDFALMLGCLGKIKNACYEDFGLGVASSKKMNVHYYNVFDSLSDSNLVTYEKNNGYNY